MAKVNVEFRVRTTGIDQIGGKITNMANEAEAWLANEVLTDTRPYVPALSGSQMNRAHVEGGSVVYPGPYARYLYYGKVMEGPPTGPKYATDRDLVYTKDTNADAQAFWFEASKAQNLQKWVKGANKIARKN